MGTGKTFWAREFVRTYPGPVVIWDPRFEFVNHAEGKDIGGALVVTNWPDFIDAQASAGHRLSLRLVFQLPIEDFPRWSQWVERCGNHLAIVDEAPQVAGAHTCTPQFRRWMQTLRHCNTSIILLSQRPVGLDTWVRTSVTHWRAFRSHLPEDLQFFRSYGTAAQVQQLPSLAVGKSILLSTS